MSRNRIYDDPARHPVNKAAGKVLGGGINYTPNKKIAQRHWSSPPSMRQSPREVENLTGRTFGRFTVIGWFAECKGLWVVRCACGDYETRKTRSVRNPQNNKDACENCRHLMFLQREKHFLRTGRDKD